MRKAVIFILVLLVLGFPGWVLEIEAQEPVVRILLFHSPSCPHCKVIISDFLPGIQEKYGDRIEIKLLDISDPYNYGLLLSLEEAAKIPPEQRGVPMVFVGHTIMVGELGIKDNLEEVIDGYLAEGGADYPIPDELLVPPTLELTATPQPTAQAENHPVHIAYFYEIGCQECDRVTYDLNYLQSKYPNLLVETFDVQNNAALSEWLGEQYGVPEEKRLTTPSVFVGQDYLLASEINVKSLEALVEKCSQTGAEAMWEDFGEEEAGEARTSLVKRLGSPALLTVLGIGLANGLNPCALATIVFFISYLAFSGRKGREILFVGVAFTLGVFLTYLLAGFGLLRLLKPLNATRSDLRNWISGLGALLCLALAFITPLVFIFMLAYFGTTSEQLARVVGRHTGTIKLLTASLFLVLAGWLFYGLI